MAKDQLMDNPVLEKIRKFAEKKLNKEYPGQVIDYGVSDSSGFTVHFPDGKILKIVIREIDND